MNFSHSQIQEVLDEIRKDRCSCKEEVSPCRLCSFYNAVMDKLQAMEDAGKDEAPALQRGQDEAFKDGGRL